MYFQIKLHIFVLDYKTGIHRKFKAMTLCHRKLVVDKCILLTSTSLLCFQLGTASWSDNTDQ